MVPRTSANFTLAEIARAAVAPSAGEANGDFCRRFAALLGTADALLTGSGRAGLYAILEATKPRRVLVPAYTCNAVTEAVRLAGREVAYVEIEPGGFNVGPDALAKAVRPGDLFVATHQFGIPCDIERIVAICHDKKALVVEDAAASLGSRVAGALTGTFGDAAFFSFDISKLVTVPLKGGAVIARDPELLARIRSAHEAVTAPMPPAVKARFLAYGGALVGMRGPHRYRAFHTMQFERQKRFTAETRDIATERGDFYRWEMAGWQSAIAARQLDRFDALVDRRRALYRAYREKLAGVRTFELPPEDTKNEWACIRFPIRVRGDKIAFYREAARRGVDMAFSFTFLVAPTSFVHAHALADAVLDLPFYFDLRDDELDTVVDVLRAMDRDFTC